MEDGLGPKILTFRLLKEELKKNTQREKSSFVIHIARKLRTSKNHFDVIQRSLNLKLLSIALYILTYRSQANEESNARGRQPYRELRKV
jgi:hypothetical protein